MPAVRTISAGREESRGVAASHRTLSNPSAAERSSLALLELRSGLFQAGPGGGRRHRAPPLAPSLTQQHGDQRAEQEPVLPQEAQAAASLPACLHHGGGSDRVAGPGARRSEPNRPSPRLQRGGGDGALTWQQWSPARGPPTVRPRCFPPPSLSSLPPPARSARLRRGVPAVLPRAQRLPAGLGLGEGRAESRVVSLSPRGRCL